jgi:hypothetical protein
VRACEASPAWRGLRVRWCGAAALPGGLISASFREENIASVARFRRHLAVVFRDRWFRRRPRVGLPDASVRVRLLFADALPADPAAQRRYLLGRLADVLDVGPDAVRLAYATLPSPVPGARHAVLCAVAGESVVHQYERALAESRVRYAGIAPSSVLRFNLFQRRLTGPPGAPVLLLAAGEATVTTILTLDGCPIFWRTRALAGAAEEGEAAGGGWCGELLRDVTEAIAYGEDRLGVNPPAHILVTGPQPGLVRWLRVQVRIPTYFLDTRRLLKRGPYRLAAEGWNRWGAALGAAARE